MNTVLALVQVWLVAAEPAARPAPAAAESGELGMTPQSYNARRAGRPITVDGRLDERVWKQAPAVGAFVDPDSGRRDGKAIEARLLWDEKTIYVGIRNADDNVTSTVTSSDGPVSEDAIEVVIRPRGGQQPPLSVRVAASGAVTEQGRPAAPPGQVAEPVKAAVRVQGTLDRPQDRDQGWTAEVAIPVAALGTPEGKTDRRLAAGDLWELNLFRRDQAPGRPARLLVWSRLFERDPHAVEQAGDLCLADEKGRDPAQLYEEQEEREERDKERGERDQRSEGRERAERRR